MHGNDKCPIQGGVAPGGGRGQGRQLGLTVRTILLPKLGGKLRGYSFH